MIQFNTDPLLQKLKEQNIWYHLFLKGSHMLSKSDKATKRWLWEYNSDIAHGWYSLDRPLEKK